MKTITAAALALSLVACQAARSAGAAEGDLVHHVTLTLQESAADRADDLLAACWSLADIPEVIALEAGFPAAELASAERPQDYTVALRVVFGDQAAHDAYIVHPLHQALLDEFAPLFAGVEVRDWWVRELE